MLVSVIVPVYNVAPYLDKCLKSICTQTYRELEIILIDDGSTDGSGEKCDRWSEKDSRIQVVHQKNGGVSSARNTGLSICTGELIGFVDSDDWLEADMIEKQEKCLTENRADAVMCGFVDYPHGAPVRKGLFKSPPCDFVDTVYQMMRRNGYFTSLWAKLFSRKIVFNNNDQYIQFDPTLAFGEDEVWLLQVLRQSKRTAFVPEALYYWRPREGSVTRSDTITEKMMSILAAKRKTLLLLPDDAGICRLARGRIYNDCYMLKVMAYCTGDRKALQKINEELRPMQWDWICSADVLLLRKLKLLMMEAEMKCGAPTELIKKTYAITHGIK